ncbi:MAG: N-acetyltransferase [Gammaproteobacteria bacterium]|jgi:putative acetyltransferase
MQEVKVRQENQSDAKAITVVNKSAFGGDAEAQLVAVVRQSKSFIPELSLVAEVGERVAGHILLFHAHLDRQGKQIEVLALAPMSVVPSQSHRGIGSTLLEAAQAKAEELGHKAIVVIGHPDYYRRFGFEHAAKWGIHSSLPVPEDSITAKELVPGTLDGGGLLVYPPEFSLLFKRTES